MEATALGEKLFLSVVVRARSVRYLSPDGRGTTKVCPGGVLSVPCLPFEAVPLGPLYKVGDVSSPC